VGSVLRPKPSTKKPSNPGRRPENDTNNILKTKSGNDARLFDRLPGRPGVTPEIPEVEGAERRGLFGFFELNIRSHRFVYFRYQSIKDVFFHMWAPHRISKICLLGAHDLIIAYRHMDLRSMQDPRVH
jgi:hypothetical protein